MEQRIKERFSENTLQETMGRYAITQDQIRLLDGFESFIYEFERGNGAYILRIGHSLRRSVSLIQGEVDWINYLSDGGASVARAILSENGRLVERINDGQGDYFLATAFIKARGQPPRKKDWNAELFERYGRLIGRMHALSKDYQPSDPAWRRPHWDDPEMIDIQGWLPDSESGILEKYCQLKEHLDTLPRDRETYGLIHQDAHASNFFVDQQGNITLFDFDDCTYSWYANDVAIVLFYAAMGTPDEAAFTREFMTHFLRGYCQENRLDPVWLTQIPHFLKLREIDLYAVIHRSFDVDNLDNPWCARYMDGRKEKIENDVPFIDFEFESLSHLVKV